MGSVAGRFPTTRLSAIAAAHGGDDAARARSWDAIVAAYWKPAYKHLRVRWRMSREDAADVVQSFFERAIDKELFAGYEPARARFRTFFRTCLDGFASNTKRDAAREKRGGGAVPLSLDFDRAEDELAKSAAASPDELFDREWRRAVLGLAIAELERTLVERDRAAVFRAFARYDLADAERPTYDDVARELGVPATTVTNYIAQARRELRRILLEKLEAITATDDELRDEARLFLEAP